MECGCRRCFEAANKREALPVYAEGLYEILREGISLQLGELR